MNALLDWLANNWLFALTTAVAVCSVIAKATKNETDNKLVSLLQRIVDVIAMSSTPTKYTGDRLKMGKGGFVSPSCLLVLAILSGVLLFGSGCALKNLSPEDQAIAVTDELTIAYKSVRGEYLDLIVELPPDQSAWLVDNVAPILDEGRDALILARESVATWKAYKIKPDDLGGQITRVRRLIADAWSKMVQLTGQEV
ncbi:MAG: hypothetical protein JEY79_14055 [Pseudodesulfovibrio sp.]|nr:hypothetical protein [Pseudodesulfovibrio sp.]